ncbi:RNA-directed DNA polymerase, eukaryota [Tanacetum coccineum]
MRAMVLWIINDFPARRSLSGWNGQGYLACPTCNKDTPYVRVLGKIAYVGHRRFLKKPHKWRKSLEFNGEIEDGDHPTKFNRNQIQAQLARLPTRVKGKHPSYGGVKIKRNILVELNWTKRSIFYELEYWSFLTLKHNLDIMHIEKNVLEAILNTLLMNDKSKDTAKARQDMKRLGIRSGLWLGQTKNGKCSKPQAVYMKKLKGYVRNKAKPKGSIAEGYVAEEALAFSPHYFRDVTMKFNYPDRNVDPPPLTGVIVVEEDPDVIHFDNSSDLPLSTSLNDLDNATLHIDGQSTEVDAPLDIIDLDKDDDIIDDEDALPHDLADSDDEDLANVDDDDGLDVMSADVAWGHGGDGGGDDRPPTHHIPTGCGGCFTNRGKGTRKPNLGGRKAGMLHTRQETHNLGLKKINDDKGPVPIRFEWDDKKTMMPLGDHASHWSNYLGELIREMPLYYPSWQKVPAERKAAILTKIGTQFDLKPHMQSQCWTYINAGIQQHLQKLYNTNMASLKAAHWVINPETGTYDMESSSTREYPSLIDTFFLTHTVGGVFVRDEDRALYDEMLRLQRLGSNTEMGVPYTEEEIMAIVRKGKQRGHLPGVGRVKMMMRLFRSDNKFSQMLDQFESSPEFGGPSGGDGYRDDEPGGDEDGDEDEEDGDSYRCYIYGLTETLRAPPKSLKKVARERIPSELPHQRIPGDMSLGMSFPSNKSPGKDRKCRWGNR